MSNTGDVVLLLRQPRPVKDLTDRARENSMPGLGTSLCTATEATTSATNQALLHHQYPHIASSIPNPRISESRQRIAVRRKQRRSGIVIIDRRKPIHVEPLERHKGTRTPLLHPQRNIHPAARDSRMRSFIDHDRYVPPHVEEVAASAVTEMEMAAIRVVAGVDARSKSNRRMRQELLRWRTVDQDIKHLEYTTSRSVPKRRNVNTSGSVKSREVVERAELGLCPRLAVESSAYPELNAARMVPPHLSLEWVPRTHVSSQSFQHATSLFKERPSDETFLTQNIFEASLPALDIVEGFQPSDGVPVQFSRVRQSAALGFDSSTFNKSNSLAGIETDIDDGYKSGLEIACLPADVPAHRPSFINNKGTLLNLQALYFSSMPFLNLKQYENTITDVNISFNRLTTFPMELLTLQRIRRLNIRNNPILSLPAAIESFKELNTFDVAFCSITSLPGEICELRQLRLLDMSFNHLYSLPMSLGNLHSLRYLHLAGNSLLVLPKSMLQLRLRAISLEGNLLESSTFGSGSYTLSEPVSLVEMAAINVFFHGQKHHDMNFSTPIRRILDSALQCDICCSTLVGQGLRMVRLCDHFGHSNLPFSYRVCSASCARDVRKHNEAYRSLLESRAICKKKEKSLWHKTPRPTWGSVPKASKSKFDSLKRGTLAAAIARDPEALADIGDIPESTSIENQLVQTVAADASEFHVPGAMLRTLSLE